MKDLYQIKCPLCDAPMLYLHDDNTGVHSWHCEDCPAILFEYYDPDSLKGLAKSLKVI